MFFKAHLKERPDLLDPAVDFVGLGGSFFEGFCNTVDKVVVVVRTLHIAFN